MTIEISLYSNRAIPGFITAATKDSVLAGPLRCLGRADNARAREGFNPTRSTVRKWGDTPTGHYKGTLGAVVGPAHTYGPHPVIALTPTAGDALVALQNGRDGLLIHGGDLSSQGQLRPTYGCIRVANETQKILTDLLAPSGTCEVIIQEIEET